ncbi:hypothetical protein [Simiduia aestuariiviva]|uniref:DUF883 domain-containing protein n=1 Tax=Simiduia aestuariiviva TaxID=1510459 RepID=A0A839UNG7_9GAMM|nr:hypothetical protein [Simiduia aestuariiviva]MBB3169382.1 hypothetical protein [Simiduia aestuariiviva]
MSLQQITDNIDTQLQALEQSLQNCEQQLADCAQERQPFLEREIEALKTTRTKLIKSRALAIRAFELRQLAEQPPAPAGRGWLWRSALILMLAAIATLIALVAL